MNNSKMTKLALFAAIFGGATCLAGETYLAEASSEPTELNNMTNKPAALLETLLLPAAWGDTNAPTLTVVGEVIQTEEGDLAYEWNTTLYPDVYLVQLAYGTTNFTAAFTVNALAKDEWGTLNLDNRAVRTAANSETLTLPASWGESVSGLKLVYKDALGTHEQTIADASQKTLAWSTIPLMPGAWTAYLTWLNGQTEEAQYTVEAAGEGVALNAAAIDNQFDEDPAGDDVRNIANHTNVFKLAWVGQAGTPVLTLDGEATGATADENGDWTWATNGLTYALYSFTNTVDGSNYVARFRVNANNVAVMFHKDTNDVLVAKSWYQDNVQELGVADSRKVISDALKQTGDNGYAYWKSYVLNIDPNTEVNFNKSNIAVTNIAPNKVEVTVWPVNYEQKSVISGANAKVVYTIDYTDSLDGTPSWTVVKQLIEGGDVKYTETLTDHAKRFYRTNLDVEPTAKTQQ